MNQFLIRIRTARAQVPCILSRTARAQITRPFAQGLGRARRLFLMMLSVCLCSLALHSACAQDKSEPVSDGVVQENPLAGGQTQLATRFKKLEGMLLRSAEVEAGSNPARAALMQQAAALAKQVQLSDSLVRAARSLEQKQYSQAIEDQKASLENLNKILELLQSENRADRVREQRDQIRRTIEETERLLRLQSSLRGRTEGGSQTEKAANDQQKLAEKAAQIAKDLDPDSKDAKDKDPSNKDSSDEKESKDNNATDKKSDEKSDADSDGNQNKKNGEQDKEKSDKEKADENPSGEKKDGQPSDDNKSGDKSSPDKNSGDKSNDKKADNDKNDKDKNDKEKNDKEKSDKDKDSDKQGDSKSSDGEKSDDKKQSSDPQKSSQNEPSPSKPSQPSEQSPQQSPDSQQPSSEQQDSSSERQAEKPKSPTERAVERMKQAQKRMEEAQGKLKEAERKGAVEKQRQAEQELKTAIEELEEILRQLREEEIERSLTALEERLRLMLQLQNKVLDESKRLAEIGAGGNDRQVEIRANNLANDEKKIVNEAQRALLLLREEGTSAAFPESLAHIISDMQKVVERLSKADVGKLTIGIEEDIVSSLEELVAAMSEIKKENKERKENQMQMPGQQQGQPGEQPLVNQLAEMRLIKTLQVRINKRTQTLSEVLKDPSDPVGQAEASDIQSQLRELAERQSSIKQVTRDIVTGKNKQ